MLHILLWTCLIYTAVALLLLVVNLLVLPRLSRIEPARFASGAPFLSIVVPARNEERAIEPAVRSLLAQDYPNFEVIVVDDRSTDGTRHALAVLESHTRLTVVDGAEPPAGWLGKPHALFQGSRAARGDLLLFVDADVRYDPTVASRAISFLLREQADFAAFLPRLETRGFWEGVLMPNLLCAVFFSPSFLINRDRPRWLAAGGGAGNLIRRQAYDALGGHGALRASVIDDVRLAVAAKQASFKTRLALAHDLVAVRMYHGFREVRDGFTKNIAYAMGGAMGVLFGILSLGWTVVTILPAAVLIAAAFGAPPSPGDLGLAGASAGLLLLARVLMNLALGDPVWPAFTTPLMSSVWAAIMGRSVYQRLVRRTVPWRGREFDARKAGF